MVFLARSLGSGLSKCAPLNAKAGGGTGQGTCPWHELMQQPACCAFGPCLEDMHHTPRSDAGHAEDPDVKGDEWSRVSL